MKIADAAKPRVRSRPRPGIGAALLVLAFSASQSGTPSAQSGPVVVPPGQPGVVVPPGQPGVVVPPGQPGVVVPPPGQPAIVVPPGIGTVLPPPLRPWLTVGCYTTRATTPVPSTNSCPDVQAPSVASGVPLWKGELVKFGKLVGDHYCDYTFTLLGKPRLVDPPSLAALTQVLPTSELACPVIVPLGDTDDSASMSVSSGAELEQHYGSLLLQTVGRPSWDSTGVRVAVVDTAAVPYDATCAPDRCDRNPHGRSVGRTIAELVCPSEAPGRPCAAIRNHVGLPIVSARAAAFPDRVRGGNLGTHFDLARGINEAVDSWASIPAANRPRLIINLSVGWHAVHHSVAPQDLRNVSDPQAFPASGQLNPLGRNVVRRAIERARCLGALVIAAAGNAVGADRAGPLYPAAWEQEQFSRAGCGAFGGSTASEATEPLVYAVSAVDHAGRLLSNTRSPGGVARRAALGLMVGARELRGAAPNTSFFSGTSMATAVVSGIAAAIWSEAPAATPRQVMALLDARLNATSTPRSVDLCLRAAGRSTDTTPCTPVASYGVANFCGRPDGCSGAIAAVPPASDVRPVHPGRGPICATPGPRGTCASSASAPATAHYLFEPWVAPQPTDPGCSSRCLLFLTAADLKIYLPRLGDARPIRADLFSSAHSLGALTSLDLGAFDLDPSSEEVLTFQRSGVFDSATVALEFPTLDGRTMDSEHPIPLLDLRK